MLDTIPDQISYTETELAIQWKDGKECRFNLLMLRKRCPCAQCRGGHGVDDSHRTTGGIQDIRLVSWKKVGRYAVQLNWSDGHDLGIFTYDELRASCDDGRDYDA